MTFLWRTHSFDPHHALQRNININLVDKTELPHLSNDVMISVVRTGNLINGLPLFHCPAQQKKEAE